MSEFLFHFAYYLTQNAWRYWLDWIGLVTLPQLGKGNGDSD